MGEVEQLVRRSKKRNSDAFTELMQLHEQDMYRTASAILSQDADIAGRHAGDDSHLLGENRHVAEKSVFQDLDDPYSDQ
ncbi:MAG: hypothetical protein ACLR6I_12725 [Waltera sp.]